MRILRTKAFVKEYLKLHASARLKVDRQLKALSLDIGHSGVKARKMINQGNIWEARVNGHYRMTFQIERDIIILRRVGTHAIYRKP